MGGTWKDGALFSHALFLVHLLTPCETLLQAPALQRQAAPADPQPTLTPTMAETLNADDIADAIAPGGIDAGHTAWILMSCALVNFMTPGLAFFYGGLVRRNHVLRVAASSTVTRVPRHSES